MFLCVYAERKAPLFLRKRCTSQFCQGCVKVPTAGALLRRSEWATASSGNSISRAAPAQVTASERPIVSDRTALRKHWGTREFIISFSSQCRDFICTDVHRAHWWMAAAQLTELISAATEQPAVLTLVYTMREKCRATAQTNNPSPLPNPQSFHGNLPVACQEIMTSCPPGRASRLKGRHDLLCTYTLSFDSIILPTCLPWEWKERFISISLNVVIWMSQLKWNFIHWALFIWRLCNSRCL